MQTVPQRSPERRESTAEAWNPLSCCVRVFTPVTRQKSDSAHQKQTVTAIRAEAAGVTLKPFPSVLQLCRVEPQQRLSGCFIWKSQSAHHGARNKASSSSADQKLLCSDYPHEKFIVSRWGDFYSDGTPGTIKQNYENASPLPVHRWFEVDEVSPGPNKNTGELNFLFCFCVFFWWQPLEKPAYALECRSPESKEWEASIVWRAAFSGVIQSESAIFNHWSAWWFHPS